MNTILSKDKNSPEILKILLPLYRNISVDRRLSNLEDAKFDEQTGNTLVYLRTFEELDAPSVPKSWCQSSSPKYGPIMYKNQIIKHRRLSKQLLDAVVHSCFTADRNQSAHSRTKLRHSLRRLSNAFEEANISLIMTYGPMLGSLRYHQCMFNDVDYDFLVNEHDMESAVGILARLSANASAEMRLLDTRTSYGMLKFGFLCGDDPLWRQRDKRCVEMNGSYVVCGSVEATAALLSPCQYYADFYWMRRSDHDEIRAYTVNTIFAQTDVLHSDYRPLDGTLFRYVRNFDRYAEDIYGTPISMCVPKSGKLGQIDELPEFILEEGLYCTYFAVPCVYIDKTHPRVHTLTDGAKKIEVGLRWLESGECSVYSLFVKFK
ncbi:hypothetical protein SprV_0501951300 [Sparganum proliferum]